MAATFSRSSTTRFESHETQANDLSRLVNTYLHVRGRVLPTNLTSTFGDSFTRDKELDDVVNREKGMSYRGTELHKLFEAAEGDNQYAVLKSEHSKVVIRRTLVSNQISEEYTNHLKASEDAPHVLQVKEQLQELEFNYVVFEYSCCTLEDVVNFIKTRDLEGDNNEKSWIRRAPWGEMGTVSPLKMKLIAGIVNGVDAIHCKDIIHRRLTSESVKIVYRAPCEVIVKISDFGLSKLIGDNKFLPSEKSTSRWPSPEQIREEKESYLVDTFALGCLIHYVVYGSHLLVIETLSGISRIKRSRTTRNRRY